MDRSHHDEGPERRLIPLDELRGALERGPPRTARLTRKRDPDVAFLERVLSIEHGITRQQLETADVVIEPPLEERDVR